MSNEKSDFEVCCAEEIIARANEESQENNIKQIQREVTDDISNLESPKEEFGRNEVEIQIK